MSDNLSSKPKTDIFAMASYSLYYGSLALVIAGCLVTVADLLYHHDVNNYRIIMPLNTLLLLCMATLVEPLHALTQWPRNDARYWQSRDPPHR